MRASFSLKSYLLLADWQPGTNINLSEIWKLTVGQMYASRSLWNPEGQAPSWAAEG